MENKLLEETVENIADNIEIIDAVKTRDSIQKDILNGLIRCLSKNNNRIAIGLFVMFAGLGLLTSGFVDTEEK